MTNRKLTHLDVPNPDYRDTKIPYAEWERNRNNIKLEIAAAKEHKMLNAPAPILDTFIAAMHGITKLCQRMRGSR